MLPSDSGESDPHRNIPSSTKLLPRLQPMQQCEPDDRQQDMYPLDDILLDLEAASEISKQHSASSLVSETPSSEKEEGKGSAISRLAQMNKLLSKKRTQFYCRIKGSRFHGWRLGVAFGCCMSTFVLCANIAITVVGTRTNGGYKNRVSDLVAGSAASITRWSTGAHLLINICSTILLGASNFTMQVLSSPTRDDIDRAHAAGKWLDVGILSTRNLWRIPRKRTLIWLLLVSSSVPLHLFYNAAIFQLATDNKYHIFATNEYSRQYFELAKLSTNTTEFCNHTSTGWRDFYDKKYVSDVGDLHLFIDAFAFQSSQNASSTPIPKEYVLEMRGDQESLRMLKRSDWASTGEWITFEWIDMVRLNASDVAFSWESRDMPYAAHISKAISKVPTTKSSLQISLDFMLVVISFNVFKLCTMTWVLFTDRSNYIVTIGDAVASFLERPDPSTRLECMLSKEDIQFKTGNMPYLFPEGENLGKMSSHIEKGTWEPKRKSRSVVLGRDRRVFLAILLCSTLSANAIVPMLGLSGYVWGTSSDVVVNSASTGTLFNAWIVNTPQIGLSFCYLALNSVCTSLAGAQEWDNLSQSRKGLRVTDPRGEQRSTYFLQLPYRWAIPLMIVSAILHWVLSQSFFLVRLNTIDRDGQIDKGKSISACGFSRLSFSVFWGIASVLALCIVAMAMSKMQQKMPIAGSCSLVISAACHPPDDDKEPHVGKVRWGVVTQQFEEGYDHCCITSTKGLERPVVGKIYR